MVIKGSYGDPVENTIANPYGRLWTLLYGWTRSESKPSKQWPEPKRKPKPKPKRKKARRSADVKDPTNIDLDEPGTLSVDAYKTILDQCILESCHDNVKIANAAIDRCREVEQHARRSGYGKISKLGIRLVKMYSQCGLIEDARLAFDRMRAGGMWTRLETIACNMLISAYARGMDLQGYEDAVLLFNQMSQRNPISWNTLLVAAAGSLGSKEARFWFQRKPHHDLSSWNAMLAADAKDGHLYYTDAQTGDSISSHTTDDLLRDASSGHWNAEDSRRRHYNSCIAADPHYVSCLELFQRGLLEGAAPDRKTFLAVLQACRHRPRLASRMEVLVVESGCIAFLGTRTTLIEIYRKCGSFWDAKRVFDYGYERDLSLWTSTLSALARSAWYAHFLFWRMPQHGLVTSTIMIYSYAQSGNVNQAAYVFNRCPVKDHLCWCTMVAAYAQNRCFAQAKSMFDYQARFVMFDQHFWNTMVLAYAQNGYISDAIQLLCRIDLQGGEVTNAALSCIFHACVQKEMFSKGKIIHQNLSNIYENDVVIGTSILNLYGRSGDIHTTKQLFDSMRERNSLTWTSMLAAYAQNGFSTDAFSVFWLMVLEGIAPDVVTFISLLSACNGRVRDVFQSMIIDYGLTPVVEHYKCMIDHLGRSGKLQEAEELARTMPFNLDEAVLTSLLNSCRLFGDATRGKLVAGDFNPTPGGYVLLCNTYRSM